MALDYVLTHEMNIIYNDLVIAKCTTFSIDFAADMIEVTNIDGAPNKEYKKGFRGWTMSFDNLFTRGAPDAGETDYRALLDELRTNETPVTVAIKPVDATPGQDYESGLGFVMSLSATGSVNDAMTYSGEIQGTEGLNTLQTAAAAAAAKAKKEAAK